METQKNLLKFQIGPVQDFIAAARSTRDLWSGSYLLSWLVATGIEKIGASLAEGTSEQPSNAAAKALIYPTLEDQPLIALRFGGSSPASFVGTSDLLTPNMPNIFVAKLEQDAKAAATIAKEVAEAIRAEWKAIADACWKQYADDGIVDIASSARFDRQVARFLTITWQVLPFQSGYAGTYADLSRRLDGVRQCREFSGWREGRWYREESAMTEKDTLTGKEEAIIGGSAWFENTKKNKQSLWNILLREKHRGNYLGAITLIKRTWHWLYLNKRWKIQSLHTKEDTPNARTQFPFPSTRHIARHTPWSNADDESEDQEKRLDRLDGYFAVLAFDGDTIGKWVSGEYFKKGVTEDLHKEFSRKLGYFALKCVRPIVDACDGRLIYAGGDDVLALLPPDTALDCARFLRMAYRGDFSFNEELRELAKRLIARSRPSNEEIEDYSPHREKATSEAGLFSGSEFSPYRLPGSIKGTDVAGREISPEASVGIAIAHFKNPLQDVIRSAQAAEKRAKRKLSEGGLGRSALSVSLLKRSGEHIDWGCKWDGGGLVLYDRLAVARQQDWISSRFPYRVAQLLSAFTGQPKHDAPDFDTKAVIEAEFIHVLRQQSRSSFDKSAEAEAIRKALSAYLESLTALRQEKDGIQAGELNQYLLNAVIGLCQTLAFAFRDDNSNDSTQDTDAERQNAA